MYRFMLVVAQLVAVIVPSATPLTPVGDGPGIDIVGAGPAERTLILAAVDRFADVGLPLPDLEIRMHEDTSGCDGKQGLFRPQGEVGVIDLCFAREFLVLHELGHAWEYFALDEQDRTAFLDETGFDSWHSPETPWSRRGVERAADAIAHGLLSAPLPAGDGRDREFARFELLTGFSTPRLDRP